MTKDEFNAKFREYARTLSPTQEERDMVSGIYEQFQDLFGADACLQIGSYPRFTSITPIHDLDILQIVGKWEKSWDADKYSPQEAIAHLLNLIKNKYVSPVGCRVVSVEAQTHSVTVLFSYRGKEFSVDVVPAFSYSTNEFGQDMYKVPEVIKVRSHEKRKEFYANRLTEHRNVAWINSDPNGYIKVAANVGVNPDFRKSVKIVKRWKRNLEACDGELKLKSFHIEQVITRLFQEKPDIDIFDAVFNFFCDLPNIISKPNQIQDRANEDKFIDDYLSKLSDEQKRKIQTARDGFLIKMEELDEDDSIESLMEIYFRLRKSITEEYLFDRGVRRLTNQTLTIQGWIQKDGRDSRRLIPVGLIDNGYLIRFEIFMPIKTDYYLWKVKNDDNCVQPRGEITRDHTRNSPERTQYKGHHYVEAYAIANEVCIARARQNVILLH